MNSQSRDFLFDTYSERKKQLDEILNQRIRGANASPAVVWFGFTASMIGLAALCYVLRVVDFELLWNGNHQHLWTFGADDIFFGLASACLAAGMMFLAWKETDLAEIDHDIHVCDRFLDAARKYEQQCQERGDIENLDLSFLRDKCDRAERRIDGLSKTRRGILYMPKPGVILSVLGIIGMALV